MTIVPSARCDLIRSCSQSLPGGSDFLEKHAVAALGDLIGEVSEHAGEERITERLTCFVVQWNDHAQGLRALESEVTRRLVEHVPALAREAQYSFALAGRDERAPCERTRDRGNVNARKPRQVGHFGALRRGCSFAFGHCSRMQV